MVLRDQMAIVRTTVMAAMLAYAGLTIVDFRLFYFEVAALVVGRRLWLLPVWWYQKRWILQQFERGVGTVSAAAFLLIAILMMANGLLTGLIYHGWLSVAGFSFAVVVLVAYIAMLFIVPIALILDINADLEGRGFD